MACVPGEKGERGRRGGKEQAWRTQAGVFLPSLPKAPPSPWVGAPGRVSGPRAACKGAARREESRKCPPRCLWARAAVVQPPCVLCCCPLRPPRFPLENFMFYERFKKSVARLLGDAMALVRCVAALALASLAGAAHLKGAVDRGERRQHCLPMPTPPPHPEWLGPAARPRGMEAGAGARKPVHPPPCAARGRWGARNQRGEGNIFFFLLPAFVCLPQQLWVDRVCVMLLLTQQLVAKDRLACTARKGGRQGGKG